MQPWPKRNGSKMWPFYSQITLSVMKSAVSWCIPDSDFYTIQVWTSDPALYPKAFKTYWLGNKGLAMLNENGFFPAKKAGK